MKCNEAELWILLQDSNELATSKQKILNDHLKQCTSCIQFQANLDLLQENTCPMEEPSPFIINNINREARKEAPQPKLSLVRSWKPAIGIAAGLLMALGLFFSKTPVPAAGIDLTFTETELLEPHDQLIDVMYSGLSEDDLAFNFLMTYDENI